MLNTAARFWIKRKTRVCLIGSPPLNLAKHTQTSSKYDKRELGDGCLTEICTTHGSTLPNKLSSVLEYQELARQFSLRW